VHLSGGGVVDDGGHSWLRRPRLLFDVSEVGFPCGGDDAGLLFNGTEAGLPCDSSEVGLPSDGAGRT
jgi:hypothetical protein